MSEHLGMKAHVIGGGTMVHIRPHFSVSAPAYGNLARQIFRRLEHGPLSPRLHLSKMAGTNPAPGDYAGTTFETNDDLKNLLDGIIKNPERSVVFLTAAVCDWAPTHGHMTHEYTDNPGPDEPQTAPRGMYFSSFGKDQPRLHTRLSNGDPQSLELHFRPAEKLIGAVRKERKDIFLVSCKTVTGVSDEEMFLEGLRHLKRTSSNLVLVNDTHRHQNMIVTPEQAQYGAGMSRAEVVETLVSMAIRRSQGTFTRTTVVPGSSVPWSDPQVFPALRKVVNHGIQRGAYKNLLGGGTVGHFAAKIGPNRFITSQRKTDFNELDRIGMVEVEAQDDGKSILAYGAKPSVGGQSQRIIFAEHPEMDCIFHAHIPLKEGAGTGEDGYGAIGVASQFENECGSHQCGRNTSNHLRKVAPGIKAVMLEKHGPNVVFNHAIDPNEVIRYLEATFDFSSHTGVLK